MAAEVADTTYDELSRRIEDLSHRTEVYKTEVNIVGGVAIGILVLLVIAVIWLFVTMRKLGTHYSTQAEEINPMDKRFALARPHLRRSSTDSTQKSNNNNNKKTSKNSSYLHQNRNTVG